MPIGRRARRAQGGSPVAEREAVDGLKYEVVWEASDEVVASRLASRLQDGIGDRWPVHRSEEGPTWILEIEFPRHEDAEAFFASDLYRQFCIETRRTCRSSVLVVPLGARDED